MSEPDNGFKSLRKYCQELGITPATTGQTIDQLVAQARKADDPRAWLAAIADAPPEEDGGETRGHGDAERLSASPLLRVPASPAAPKPAAPSSPLPAPRSTPKPPPRPAKPPAEIHCFKIFVPVSSEEPEGYLEREMHLDVKLDRQASCAFRRLQAALNQTNARLGNGRHVGRSRADVVRWVFERLAKTLAEVTTLEESPGALLTPLVPWTE
jgi:hypothetical protein